MGRLIEAETLKASVRAKFPNVADRCEINELVNAAPTVDAIPVAWLLNWRDSALKEGMNPELVEWIEYILQIWSREKEG